MPKKIYVGADNFARRNLSSGYTQVEYIQSSGTQYINTEFNPKYNSRIVVDASGLGTQQWLFGTRDTASATATQQFCMYRTASAARADYFGGASKSLSVSDTTARMIYNMNANVLTFGEQTITNTAASSGTCSRPLYLLTLNNVGTAHANGAQVKLYSCKIYDGATLVRDFVPCTNSSGTAGLYDLVNSQFYTNAGTGTFTIGSIVRGNVAKRVKKLYIGVGNKAKKVKKGYIGINGKAKLFFTPELGYKGTITDLSVARHRLGASHNGEYAIFAGGYKFGETINGVNYNHDSDAVDAYNKALQRTTTTLGKTASDCAGTHVGNYAVFSIYNSTITTNAPLFAFNSALSRTDITAQNNNQYYQHASHIGNYALFSSNNMRNGRSVNDSLTISELYDSNLNNQYLVGGFTHVGNYALMIGTNTSAGVAAKAYNSSLQITRPTAFSDTTWKCQGATYVGNYAVFYGYYVKSSRYSIPQIEWYDTSLTRQTPIQPTNLRFGMSATTIGDYAIFAGGYVGTVNSMDTASSPLAPTNMVEAFDTSLTRTNEFTLNTARANMASTHIGSYAIFAGGKTGQQGSSVITQWHSVAEAFEA